MPKQMTTRDPWWVFSAMMNKGEAFHTRGSLWGEPIEAPYHFPHTGQMPRTWAEVAKGTKVDYVVWSYGTPVAWRQALTGHWTAPDVKYSSTTSRHQTKIFTAVDEINS